MQMKHNYLKVIVGILLMVMSSMVIAGEAHVRAKAEMSAGNYSAARSSLQTLLKQSPRDHQAWFLLGVLHAKQQYYHQAIEAFRRVIELKPLLAEPHNNLAVIYNELDDLHAAVKELEVSLKKRPGYVVAEENVADLYVKLALKSYKSALEKGAGSEVEQRYARLLQVRDPHAKFVKIAASEKLVKKVTPKIVKKSTISKAVTSTKKPLTSDQVKQEVLAAVEAWRSAWSEQRVDDYFAMYGKGFKVKKKYASVRAWKKVARRVISQKTYLDVQLKHLSVVLAEDNLSAKVEFTQYFKSNNFNATGVKFLHMQRDGKHWKIVREGSVTAAKQKNTAKAKVLRQLAPVEPFNVSKNTSSVVSDRQVEKIVKKEDPKQAVLTAVEAWRAAWSAQNADQYFAAYAKSFKVKKKFGSVKNWQEVMRRVMRNKAFIDVRLDDILVVMGNNGKTAKVRFLQYFRSDTYQDDDLKMLHMKLFKHGWKIVREESIS